MVVAGAAPRRARWRWRWRHACSRRSPRPTVSTPSACRRACSARIEPSATTSSAAAIAENIPPFVLAADIARDDGALRVGAARASRPPCCIVRPRVHRGARAHAGGFTALALMANRNVPLLYWVLAPLGAIALAPRAIRPMVIVARRGPVWRGRVPPWPRPPPLAARPGGGDRPRGRGAGARAAHRRADAVSLPDRIGPAAGAHGRERPRLRARPARRVPDASRSPRFGLTSTRASSSTPRASTQDYLAARRRAGPVRCARRARAICLRRADHLLPRSLPRAGRATSRRAPRGRLLYTDGSEVLFARQGAAVSLADRATVDAVAAEPRCALPIATRRARRGPHQPRPAADRRRPTCRGRAGARADRLARRGAAPRPRPFRRRRSRRGGEPGARDALGRCRSDVSSLTLLAEIALARRAAGDARTYLARALSVDPYDPEARALLARHDGHAAALPPGRVRTVR